MKEFRKHVSNTEKAVAVILWLLLVLAIVAQLFFGGGVLALILVIAICAGVYSFLVFVPEVYEFRDDSFAVVNTLLHRSVTIPYATILHIDTVGTFRSSKRDFDSVEVIVKYRPQGKKRVRSISAHPTNVRDFFNLLQARCPNLIPETD